MNRHSLGFTADTLSLDCFNVCKFSSAPPGLAKDLNSARLIMSENLRTNLTWTTSHLGLSREDLGS